MTQQAVDTTTPNRAASVLPSVILIVLFALAAMLSLRGLDPPAPLAADAPADAFSAARAREVLVRLLGDEAPHPTGSAANAAVRDRVVAEFAALGLEARVQRRFVCGTQNCATVENIVARLPGASRERAVLLSAHYDSVAAGPGASDDGAGVAALLEATRALKAGPPLPRDVWLLVNDGEEIDLLGAEAFVREPEFAGIAAVVNLEARGTRGVSFLIETQPGNAAVIAGVRNALSDPAGTSLDYEIYKALPNDTDFTVYRREGRSGTSFALAGGASRYHTRLDNLAQLDDRSLQHHGDNMLAMARELAAAKGELKRSHDAVFFDLGGATLVTWPVTWNLPLLVLGLAAFVVLVVRVVRAKQARIGALFGASAVGMLLLVVAIGLGIALQAVLGALGATPAAWTAQESHLVDGFALLAVALLGLLAAPMARRFGAEAVAIATLVPFALIATITVLTTPGASHVGLLPLLAGAVAGNLFPRRPVLWAGIAGIVAALLWFPYVVTMYMAMGAPALPASTLLATLALLPLLPALARLGRGARWVGAAALAGTLAFATLAVTRPAFDDTVPRTVNLLYIGSGAAPRVFVDPYAELPPGFNRDAGFEDAIGEVLPWSRLELNAGRAGPALAAPTLEIVADTVHGDRRHLRVRLRSTRGATEGGVRLPGDVDRESIRVDGQPLLAPRHGPQGTAKYRAISRIALPADGVLVDFEMGLDEAFDIYGVDASPGIPAELADVAAARDRIGMPVHGGDISIAWVKLKITSREHVSQ